MNSRNWAKEEATRIINSEGFRDTPADVIAAALQQVADECAGLAVMYNDAAEEIREGA